MNKRAAARYLSGQLDYLRVLESLISRQTLERNELTARVLVERHIDLCRSLAGGWEMKPPKWRSFNSSSLKVMCCHD